MVRDNNRHTGAIQTLLQTFQVDALTVEIYKSEAALAKAAAQQTCQALQRALAKTTLASIIFATGRSQRSFLATLIQSHAQTLDWSSVVGFHLDEYLGLSAKHPASFQYYLHQHIAQHLPFQTFHYLEGNGWEPIANCKNYESLLRQIQPSVCLLGVGQNGHLAFNDPPVADFQDPHWVKVVKLDSVNRQQQVTASEFSTLKDVPNYGLTLTLSAIDAVETLICLAPGKNKAEIIKRLLEGPITPLCPGSILRKHPQAKLMMDSTAAHLLNF